jgi:hypothetical protein
MIRSTSYTAIHIVALVLSQIDHDSYHKMLEEYRAAKSKQQGDELKIRQ